jgi:hypothetical protein
MISWKGEERWDEVCCELVLEGLVKFGETGAGSLDIVPLMLQRFLKASVGGLRKFSSDRCDGTDAMGPMFYFGGEPTLHVFSAADESSEKTTAWNNGNA